jgi:hypothetical protein
MVKLYREEDLRRRFTKTGGLCCQSLTLQIDIKG